MDRDPLERTARTLPVEPNPAPPRSRDGTRVDFEIVADEQAAAGRDSQSRARFQKRTAIRLRDSQLARCVDAAEEAAQSRGLDLSALLLPIPIREDGELRPTELSQRCDRVGERAPRFLVDVEVHPKCGLGNAAVNTTAPCFDATYHPPRSLCRPLAAP